MSDTTPAAGIPDPKDEFVLNAPATRRDLLDAVQFLADALWIRREAGNEVRQRLEDAMLRRGLTP